jgi:hypothetical protein
MQASLRTVVDGYVTLDANNAAALRALCDGYDASFSLMRKRQRTTAEDFDYLAALGVHESLREEHHSRFIAFMLDDRAAHAQGNLFLTIFLADEGVGLPSSYANVAYEVRREVQGEEARIDMEVRSKVGGDDGFLIHIENKVKAGLGERQLEREDADIRRRALQARIPLSRVHGLLLDPYEKPTGGTLFKWIGWEVIERCLERFVRAVRSEPQGRAERAAFAAEQYLCCIRSQVLGKVREEAGSEESSGKA